MGLHSTVLPPFILMHSFIPRQVHQGDTKQERSSLSSSVDQNSHEKINIFKKQYRV